MNRHTVKPQTYFGFIALAICCAFIISCVFDPGDKIFGLKIPLFTFIGILSSISLAGNLKLKIDKNILIITSVFLALPFLAFLNALAFADGSAVLGFMMLKGYLLILLLPMLFILKVDILPTLAFVLFTLAIVIIITSVLVWANPSLYPLLKVWGDETGLFIIDKRSYGGMDLYTQIYFVTSPMLLISIAYYFSRLKGAIASKKVFYFIATTVCIAAMVFAGTRNNIFSAYLLTVGIVFLNIKNKLLLLPVFLVTAITVLIIYWGTITEMLNPSEYSNSVKLNLVGDYLKIFNDPFNLIFGQGLGVETYWQAKEKKLHLSELTYFEMVRNFGVIGSFTMLAILFFPIFKLLGPLRTDRTYRNLSLSYVMYLLVCFSNPNLFSSMGVLIFVALTRRSLISFKDQTKYA